MAEKKEGNKDKAQAFSSEMFATLHAFNQGRLPSGLTPVFVFTDPVTGNDIKVNYDGQGMIQLSELLSKQKQKKEPKNKEDDPRSVQWGFFVSGLKTMSTPDHVKLSIDTFKAHWNDKPKSALVEYFLRAC